MAIRPDTDPKSPAPRSGAPMGELEQYGVWVKAEPRDIVDEAPAPSAGDFDLELSGDSAAVPEEAFLSEDEEKLLGTFDADFKDAEPLAEGTHLPDIEDLPPLDEPILESQASGKRGSDEVEDLDAGTIDISLEELESGHDSSPISPYAEVDMAAIEGLDEAAAIPPEGQPADSFQSMEDVSSEFLDVVEEAPPSEGGSSLSADDVTAEFLGSEEPAAPRQQAERAPDFEPIDMDLTFDDTIPTEEGQQESASGSEMAAFEEVTEFDDLLAEPAELAPEPKASRQPAPGFDDLAAVERDLADTVRPSAAPAAHDGASADILQKIALELSSIRGELVSLKTQLNELRTEGSAPAESQEEPEVKAAGGFFDEEEDETIALTGDELDNILNTADFTEEVADAPSSPDEDEGAERLDDLLERQVPQDISILDESILPESGDYSAQSSEAAEPAIEEVKLGESTAVERPETESRSPEFEEISLMAEEGVHPMTSAPDDTSYLETPLVPEDVELREAPPSEAPLVEPDLSDFDLEAEDLGAGTTEEIDEELPVVESSEAPLEELTLGMDAGAGYSRETPSDMEPVEPLAEIDEISLEDISLHEEDQSAGGISLEELPEIDELTPTEEAERLSSAIDERTIKPAGPIDIHPDEIPVSLDDSYFVGTEPEASAAPVESEEELVLDLGETSVPESTADLPPAPEASAAPIPIDLPMAEDLAAPQELDSGSGEPSQGEDRLKDEIRSVLAYLDKLLDSLPEDKIEEFARSEHFDTYKRLFEELGLV